MSISWNDIKEKYNLSWPVSWSDVKEAIGDEEWPVSWEEVKAAMACPRLITFYIKPSGLDAVPLTAEEGMTWEEYCNSEYNVPFLWSIDSDGSERYCTLKIHDGGYSSFLTDKVWVYDTTATMIGQEYYSLESGGDVITENKTYSTQNHA